MATLSDMIDEVRSNLAGYTLRQDRITYLNAAITTTDTAIQVGSSSNLAKGIIEIDDELIWIDNFVKTNNTLNAAPGFGRGFQNSTPAPHSQYAQITLSPTFPRMMVKQAINDTINSVYPKLWAVTSTTFTFNAAQTTYALPDDLEAILYISWQTTGSSQEWLPVNKWRADPMANIATFNSQNTVNIYESIQPGRTVQVYYTSTPTTLDSSTDDFTDVSGLPETCRDVITLGAAYKLLSYIDSGRINLTSAEADSQDSKIPSTAGTSSSRYIYAVYQNRLNEEALKLQDKYPIRLHYTKQVEMASRKYSTISIDTTLASSINSSVTSLTVAVGTGTTLMGGVSLTAGDTFALAIDPETSSEEIVFVTAVSSDTFTVTRAQASTSGIAHSTGATIQHVFTGDDAQHFEDGINAAVTLTGTQTLSNKTLTAPKFVNGGFIADANGNEEVIFVTTASAVNELTVTNAATTGTPSIAATGGDTNISLNLVPKGTGTVQANAVPLALARLGINAQTGTAYTLVAGDLNKLVTLTNANLITLTVPNGVFSVGDQIHLARLGAGGVTVASDGTSVIQPSTTLKLRVQYSAASLICTTANNFLLIGDITA